MTPEISVIITAFNRKEFLERAINSAIGQSFPDQRYEIIIVTNFTPSVDPAVLNKFKGEIKYIRFTTEQISEMLLLGIKNSRGNIICFLDDDDLFTEEKLQRVYEVFTNHPDLVYYHNNYLRFRDCGNLQKGLFWTNKSLYIPKKEMKVRKIREVIRKGGNFNLSCISVKRSQLGTISNKDWNFNYLPDSMLFYFMLGRGDFIVDSTVLTHYHSHKSVSNQGIDSIVKKTIEATQQMCDAIQGP